MKYNLVVYCARDNMCRHADGPLSKRGQCDLRLSGSALHALLRVENQHRLRSRRVDRTKYQIQIPLPPKIDPTVTMMTVEEKPDVTYSDIGGCKEQVRYLATPPAAPFGATQLYRP